jgi:hypothetical protein
LEQLQSFWTVAGIWDFNVELPMHSSHGLLNPTPPFSIISGRLLVLAIGDLALIRH